MCKFDHPKSAHTNERGHPCNQCSCQHFTKAKSSKRPKPQPKSPWGQ
jgi:hypothetical protein